MTTQSITTSVPRAFSGALWTLIVMAGCHMVIVDWLLLAAAAPLLLFPSQYTLVGAGLITVGWVTRRVATGSWSVPSATLARGSSAACLADLASALREHHP
jgi:hypothetical protein